MLNKIDNSFIEGDLVNHKIFGIGKVTSVDDISKSYVITFDNERLKDSRVISMKYAGLSRV